MIVPFLVGTVAVVMMFQVNTYMGLAKTLQMQNVPFGAVVQDIYYRTPYFLSLTLPLGMALASSLMMTRFARESELTAVRAAGTRILRVLWPIALFGILVSLLNFYDVEYVVPAASRTATDIESRVLGLGLSPSLVSNRVINIRQYAVSLGTVQRKGTSGDMDMTTVMLIERPDFESTAITRAQSATYRNGIWTFKNAFYYYFKGDDVVVAHPRADFVLNERIPVDDIFHNPAPEEESISELRNSIRTARATGLDVHTLELALYNKFSEPFACLVFAFVSPVFSILFARSGGFVGVLLSFVMAMAYYNVYVVCTQILVKIEWIPSLVASWSPNILFVALGLWAVRRLE
jgi:lipopolysaccharide export system permease protein